MDQIKKKLFIRNLVNSYFKLKTLTLKDNKYYVLVPKKNNKTYVVNKDVATYLAKITAKEIGGTRYVEDDVVRYECDLCKYHQFNEFRVCPNCYIQIKEFKDN